MISINANSVRGIIITVGLVLSATLLMVPSVKSAEVMTAEDVARLRSVNSVAVSPDGSLIAYTVSKPRNPFSEENGKSWSELFLTDLDGNSRPFITGEVNIGSVTFAPDGKMITYLAKRNDDDTTTVLYGLPVDGGESVRLVSFESSVSSYTWGPDSKKVAFLAKPVKDKEARKLKEKGFNAEIFEEDWRFTKVWLYDISTPDKKPTELDLKGSASSLSYSPDGTMLALALQPTPSIDDNYVARQVTIVNATTGEVLRQFANHGKLGQIEWSPDSKRIAVLAGHDLRDPAVGELYMGSPEGGELEPIMTDLDGHLSTVRWVDNNQLIYLMNRHVHAEVGRIKADGTGRKVLIEPGRPVLSRMYLSQNKKTVCFRADAPSHDSELFATTLKKMKPIRLTNSNPWLDDRALGRQEVITYHARDGLELEAMLIHPVDEQPGTRYPLVMIVHGGPESNRRDGFLTWSSSPAQVFAGQGYVVLVPNYRGSTGRGVRFSKMGQDGYAEGEFDDLVDAITYLDQIGLIDKAKVGITGGSYGGYASAWAATALTEHFAASVMSVGISDLISKFGTTDIPYEMYYAHAQTWPHEKWDWYLTQSPIYHAQKSKTPLLIMHGKNDTRVHPSQSMEMYRYLKTFGQAPVRLVFYPGEGHGNRKAAARYDYSLRLIRWMDHYLKGPGGEPPASELDYSSLKPDDFENESIEDDTE